MTPTILLVRGDLPIAHLLPASFELEEFNVQSVTTDTQALRALECHGHELRAAVFSIGRSDPSAIQLVQCIRNAILELPIVIATYLEADLDEWFQNDPHVRIISEPFDEFCLQVALREAGVIFPRGAVRPDNPRVPVRFRAPAPTSEIS